MPLKRAMLFVDGPNLFHGAKQYDEDYDYDVIALRDVLAGQFDLVRSYWFDSYQPRRKEDKEGFYTYLEMNGYRVEAKPLRERQGEFIEKGADIGLATEMLTGCFVDSYELAILVSGDGDFSRAVRVVENHGKQVVVASFEGVTSRRLQRDADVYVELDELADDFERT